MEEHYLDEPSLDLTLEKKYVDSFKHVMENPSKPITLKNYSISNGEHVKSLIQNIENTVIRHSESTLESKPIDYEKELSILMTKKQKANKLINTNLDEAILAYNNLLYDIEDVSVGMTNKLLDSNAHVKEIFNQNKLILSNLSLAYSKKQNYRTSIELDLKILGMDNKFDKSYARLVNSYTALNDLNQANYYADLMNKTFSSDVLSKYTNILDSLKRKNQEADESLRKLSKRSMEKRRESEIAVSELNDEKEDGQANNSNGYGGRMLRFIFGTSFLIGSSVMLFFLFRNRSKFLSG